MSIRKAPARLPTLTEYYNQWIQTKTEPFFRAALARTHNAPLTEYRRLDTLLHLTLAELEERAAPLAAVLAVAADADPEAAAVHAESERNRLGGAAAFVARLAAIDGLRPGLTTERAVATALVLMDPAVCRTLVREHGWARDEYAAWIERAALAELLGDTPPGSPMTPGPRAPSSG